MAFVIAHAYLTTTGKAPVSNLKAMITGYEDQQKELEDDQYAAVPAAATGGQA